MTKYLLISILFLVGLSANALSDSHHPTPKSFRVSEIAPGFHLLQGKGGNILVSEGDDGLLVVDADYLEMSEALIKTLDSFKKEVKYLVNTHWHGDHTLGNKELGKFVDILAHENVYKRLSTRQEVKLFNKVSEPYPDYALPDITYENEISVHINGDTAQILHLPGGHTDGDSIVLFEAANIIHMGDLFFNGFFPFVDVGSGGNVTKVAENINSVLGMINDKTLIVPGHGPLASKTDLTLYRDMIIGTVEEVRALKEQGLTKAEIQQKGLSSKWGPWTKGFLSERVWISIIYSSL